MSKQNEKKIINTNRQARHEYFFEEILEAGIALTGTEVKALREGKGNLKDSFARIENGEVFLYNMHISPYDFGNRFNHNPLRPRKLLLHKAEIIRLRSKMRQQALTLIPVTLYFNEKGKVKLELARAKGKKMHDKRDAIAERDARREIERSVRGKF